MKADKLQFWSWVVYDISDTVFSLLIVTLLYAVYFKEVVFSSSPNGDLAWGISVSASILIVSIISPVLGALADYSGLKKRFLGIATFSCALFTSALYFVKRGDIFSGILFFILAYISFALCLTFYNAFLIEIADRDKIGKASGIGWAAGYAGAMVILLFLYPLIKDGFAEHNLRNIRYCFLLVAICCIVFSIPALIFLREKKPLTERENKSLLKIGMSRVYETLIKVKNYKNLSLFLIAYFFYNDGITTVIVFSSIYASSTLKFSMQELLIFFISIQVTAVIGSFLLGYVIDMIGAKKVILVTLFIWCAVVIGAYMTKERIYFYIIGMIAGFAMGSSQAASRSLMGLFTPEDRSAEFFGFFSLCGKVSGIIGPTAFGLISSGTGNQRLAILSVLIFFIAGLVLMVKVKEPG